MARFITRLLCITMLMPLLSVTGCGCDRIFWAAPQAWIDENRNGQRETGESPLSGVTFIASDRRGTVSWQVSGTSDASGVAHLSTMYGFQGSAEWIVEAQPPSGYQGTTPLKVAQGASYKFGFARVDSK